MNAESITAAANTPVSQGRAKRFWSRSAPADAPAIVDAEDRVDFPAIYKKANVPNSSFTAEETLDMIARLTPDMPLPTKQHTVLVALGAMGKAIGATPETICNDGATKLNALTAHIDKTNIGTREFMEATEREIASLQAQIAEKHAAMTAAQNKRSFIVSTCEAECNRLSELLSFFNFKR